MEAMLDDVRVHWRESGRGAPVLLLHAFPLHGAMWQPQLDELPRRWRWIAPDLRGFGRSERGPGDGPLGMDLLADDIVAMMDHLDIDRATICGLSMGGYVALALCNWHPDRVRGLVLCDTRAGADTDEARRGRYALIERVRGTGSAEPLVEALLPKLVSPATPGERPPVLRAVRELIEAAEPESVIHALEGMAQRPDSTELLRDIDSPALVIVGEDDLVTQPTEAGFMAGELPNGRLTVISDAGHLSNMENPAAFNRALVHFLEATEGD